MSLTDLTYYKTSERSIPHTFETEMDAVALDLSHYIKTCEIEVLKRAFGYEMYRDFYPYVGDGGLKSNSPQNYKDVVYGKDYEIEGHNNEKHLRNWQGLINKELCKSLLADYTYYYYWQNNLTTTTSSGEVKNVPKVSNIHSMSHKLASAYNRFIYAFQGGYNSNWNRGYCGFSLPYTMVRNRLNNGYGINYNSYSNSNYNGEVSLLTFLYENKEDYPLIKNPYMFDAGFKLKNSFGL
ncbi:hypothetical protein [uncultured Mediterranean phage uvMED]|nr:hypothetical protein [uncultured Mediterranean phage uvMED]